MSIFKDIKELFSRDTKARTIIHEVAEKCPGCGSHPLILESFMGTPARVYCIGFKHGLCSWPVETLADRTQEAVKAWNSAAKQQSYRN